MSSLTLRAGYLANIWLRSAIRVLVEMHRGFLDPEAGGSLRASP